MATQTTFLESPIPFFYPLCIRVILGGDWIVDRLAAFARRPVLTEIITKAPFKSGKSVMYHNHYHLDAGCKGA
jgi:hypothetical protein